MKRAGYSMLELLVVMAMMALFSVGIGLSLSDGRSGQRLRTAEQMMKGMVGAARGDAVLKQRRVRLLIKVDDGGEGGLQRMGLVYEAEEGENRWTQVGRGRKMPEGVYYWPEKSGLSMGKTMRLNYPRKRAQDEGVGEEWYYLEIDRNGFLNTGKERMVIGLGRRTEDGGIVFNSEAQVGGFNLYRLGSIGRLKEAEH